MKCELLGTDDGVNFAHRGKAYMCAWGMRHCIVKSDTDETGETGETLTSKIHVEVR